MNLGAFRDREFGESCSGIREFSNNFPGIREFGQHFSGFRDFEILTADYQLDVQLLVNRPWGRSPRSTKKASKAKKASKFMPRPARKKYFRDPGIWKKCFRDPGIREKFFRESGIGTPPLTKIDKVSILRFAIQLNRKRKEEM